MNRIVWLASYPKSGNTWMRAFLSAYRGGLGAAVDLNDLEVGDHAASRVLFDRVIGMQSSDLTEAEIDGLRPEVYRVLDEEAREPLFMKVHDAWRRDVHGHPIFPADVTRMAVVIVRSPLGVAPSLANHYAHTIDEAIDDMNDPAFAIAGMSNRLKPQLPQPIGSWSGHAASWLDHADLPVHLVRYEDMVANPHEVFAETLTACGLEVDAELVADAVERTRFDRLRRAEDEGGFKERRAGSPRFFRKGDPNAWRTELDDRQIESLTTVHGDWMSRLGYTVNACATAVGDTDPNAGRSQPLRPDSLQHLNQ